MGSLFGTGGCNLTTCYASKFITESPFRQRRAPNKEEGRHRNYNDEYNIGNYMYYRIREKKQHSWAVHELRAQLFCCSNNNGTGGDLHQPLTSAAPETEAHRKQEKSYPFITNIFRIVQKKRMMRATTMKIEMASSPSRWDG